MRQRALPGATHVVVPGVLLRLRLPRIVPLSCATGARPVIDATCPAVIRPSSSISSISIAAETALIPGMDRRNLAFAAEVSSCPMTLSIRRSRSPTLASSMALRSACTLSTSAGMFGFLCAEICADGCLCISTICTRCVVKSLRLRKFSFSYLRPASGRHSLNTVFMLSDHSRHFPHTLGRNHTTACGRRMARQLLFNVKSRTGPFFRVNYRSPDPRLTVEPARR